MTFIKSLKGQDFILPPRIEDLIPENHISRFIETVIDSMDFKEYEVKYEGPGHPAYHPRILLKILVMGAVDGIYSSRALMRNTRENVVYMFLAEKTQPDFRTISDFRKNNFELVKTAFVHVVNLAMTLGFVRLGHISIDGTKIKANASKKKKLTDKEIKKLEELINSEINKGIEKDDEEDKEYGKDKDGYEVPENATKERVKELIKDSDAQGDVDPRHLDTMCNIIANYVNGDAQTKAEITEMIEKANEEANKCKNGIVSISDPESRMMRDKENNIVFGYNSVITVDSEMGIIVANEVVKDENDYKQLIPQILQVEHNTGRPLEPGTIVSADNGFYTGQNLAFLEKRRLDGYIPDVQNTRKIRRLMDMTNPFHQYNFEYLWETDQIICPAGSLLQHRYDYSLKKTNQKIGVYVGTECHLCKYRDKCFKEKRKQKRIKFDKWTHLRFKMAKKFMDGKGREVYKIRSKTVERAFADIKRNRKLTGFTVYGLKNVNTQFTLSCIAYNLVKIYAALQKTTLKISGGFSC
jgi:transposase